MAFCFFSTGLKAKVSYEALVSAKNLKELLLHSVRIKNDESINVQQGLPSPESLRTYAELARRQPQQISTSLMAVQIMRYPVTFFKPEIRISEAKEAFSSLGFQLIPIADSNERVLSIVTKERVMSISESMTNEPLLSIAPPACVTATPGTLISQLGLVMRAHALSSIVIADEEGRLLGIVSFKDVIDSMQVQAYNEMA